MTMEDHEKILGNSNLEEKLQEGKESLGIKDYLSALGPGAIMAASIVGPGTVTTASVVGARYGYQAIWVLVLAAIFAYFFQEPAIRVTLLKRESLMEGIRKEVGKPASSFLYVSLLAGCIAFQAGNFTGAGMALHYIFPFLSVFGWVTTMAIAALLVCWIGVYKLFENINRVLVGLMVLSFVITAFYSGPNIGQVVREGFSFAVPGGDYILLLALLSTTMPFTIPVGLSVFLKQKYSDQAKDITGKRLGREMFLARFDLRINMIVTGLISVAIVVCAGTVLHPLGIEIKGAGDMAIQLTPLLGKFAGVLFALGLWGAGFSSGIYQISIQPPMFNDALGLADDPKARRSRILMVIAAMAPVVIVYFFSQSPVGIIVIAQFLTGLALPLITAIIWKLVRNKRYMGALVNNKMQNFVYGVIMVLVLAIAGRVFANLLGLL